MGWDRWYCRPLEGERGLGPAESGMMGVAWLGKVAA